MCSSRSDDHCAAGLSTSTGPLVLYTISLLYQVDSYSTDDDQVLYVFRSGYRSVEQQLDPLIGTRSNRID
jgi:hypothetical protein